MRETFGDVLRVLMARRGMTCAALEEAAGIGSGHVSRLRTGTRDPGPNVLDSLARALELGDTDTEAFFRAGGHVSERVALRARQYLMWRNA